MSLFASVSVSVVMRKVTESQPIVNVLVTAWSYSSLEISSIFTVHPFCTYPVVPTIFPLIYKTHLFTVASAGTLVDKPVMVTVLDPYTLSILALVILLKENESGVLSMIPL